MSKSRQKKKIILDAEERTYFCFFLALLTKCREVHAGQQNLQLMNKKHRFYWIEWSTNERKSEYAALLLKPNSQPLIQFFSILSPHLSPIIFDR